MLNLGILLYLLIIFSFGIISIIYLLAILIIVVYILIISIISNDNSFSNIDLDNLEETNYKVVSKYKYLIDYIEFNILSYTVTIKSFIYDRKKDKNIILIHGINSGSCIWLNLINSIIDNYDNYNIYSMCVPGFGCSFISNIEDLLNNDSDFVTRFYSNIINNYIHKYDLDNIILIGHSLGGYFILNYICDITKFKRKKNILGIIPINPVSIISSLGTNGFYISAFVKLGFANPIFTLFNIYSYNLLYFLTKFVNLFIKKPFDNNSHMYYFYALISSYKNYSDQILNKFIQVEGNQSFFSRPIIHKMLSRFNVPLHIISSENDIIISKYYNKVLNIFSNKKNNFVSILKGKYHSPLDKEDTLEIAKIINNFINNNTGSIIKIKARKSYLIKDIINKYVSHYNYNYSYKNSYDLFLELKNFLRKI